MSIDHQVTDSISVADVVQTTRTRSLEDLKNVKVAVCAVERLKVQWSMSVDHNVTYYSENMG